MNRSAFAIVLLAALCMSFVGCTKKPLPLMDRPEGTLAVAGFNNPKYTWQLMAGYTTMEGQSLDQDTLAALDQSLEGTLHRHGVIDFVPTVNTRQCQEVRTFQGADGKRVAAFDYWLSVGKCIQADFLLVPQLLTYRERDGKEWGAAAPASVMFDLFLIDVKGERIVVRKHYEETQKDLSADLLEAGTYFKRGGTWVTAQALVEEGLEVMLTEMGL